MTFTILNKLAGVTIGTALLFAIGETMPAQAAELAYNFSNTSKTLTGTFSFDQSAATDDQQVTVLEGLKIFATYGGQSYTQANDPSAVFLTNFLGEIGQPGQGLGLQFVIPGVFSVYSDNFINETTTTDVQPVTYSPVPEPGFLLGSSVFGLSLLFGKKKVSSNSSGTKA